MKKKLEECVRPIKSILHQGEKRISYPSTRVKLKFSCSQILCLFIALLTKGFLSRLICRFDLFPHTVCSLFFSKTLFIHSCRGVRFLEQKNLGKSMNSMLDCFVEINHVTPFGVISDQAAVSSQGSNKYYFTDEGSSFALKI